MNMTFELTLSDLTRVLSSIDIDQRLLESAERYAADIELDAEFSGNPVSADVGIDSGGAVIILTPDRVSSSGGNAFSSKVDTQ